MRYLCRVSTWFIATVSYFRFPCNVFVCYSDSHYRLANLSTPPTIACPYSLIKTFNFPFAKKVGDEESIIKLDHIHFWWNFKYLFNKIHHSQRRYGVWRSYYLLSILNSMDNDEVYKVKVIKLLKKVKKKTTTHTSAALLTLCFFF